MHKSTNNNLIVKIFIYRGGHTFIVLCSLVRHKTVVCISEEHCNMIPQATSHAQDLVLPGAAQKCPLLEHDPERMLDRDLDPTHVCVPSTLHSCWLPNLGMRAHQHGTDSIHGIPVQLKVAALRWVTLRRTRLDHMSVHELEEATLQQNTRVILRGTIQAIQMCNHSVGESNGLKLHAVEFLVACVHKALGDSRPASLARCEWGPHVHIVQQCIE